MVGGGLRGRAECGAGGQGWVFGLVWFDVNAVAYGQRLALVVIYVVVYGSHFRCVFGWIDARAYNIQ